VAESYTEKSLNPKIKILGYQSRKETENNKTKTKQGWLRLGRYLQKKKIGRLIFGHLLSDFVQMWDLKYTHVKHELNGNKIREKFYTVV